MDKKYNINKEDYDNYNEADDLCDLDPNKICDNCCKCLELDKNYRIIKITEIKDKE